MRAQILILTLGLVAGCKSAKVNDGYAIDLTLVADPSLGAADLARAAWLDLEVTGAEPYSKAQIPIAGKFDPTTRSAGIRYRPRKTSGQISIAATISDESGTTLATGRLSNVALGGGTQVLTLALTHVVVVAEHDLGLPDDLASRVDDLGRASDLAGPTCGNGVLDPGELCDPGPASVKPCPKSDNDCDDHESCTTDQLSGTGCQATCTHTSLTNGTGCTVGASAGVCLSAVCCSGCINNSVCVSGKTDAHACGSGGNACFNCTQNAANATCNAGTCSGCDATSCTSEGRTCGTSSCGANCGGCADGCSNGNLTHYACVGKSCQMSGMGNCGLYSMCMSSSKCANSCVGDNGCVATAWCGGGQCKLKVGVGQPCSAENSGDHECASPNVCSWTTDGKTGLCVPTRCTGCLAAINVAGNYCGGPIPSGYDPRSACQSYAQSACHRNWCSGYVDPQSGTSACDYGLNEYGSYRSCGTVTCASDSNGFGTLTGRVCFNQNCISGSTLCASDRCSYACNAAKTDCDYTNQTCG